MLVLQVQAHGWPVIDSENGCLHPGVLAGADTEFRVRLAWRDDGQEVQVGEITRRANGCVYVELDDPRLATYGVWVRESDVQPRV